MGGKATKVKEYTLEKSKQFVIHIFKHGIPEKWKLSVLGTFHIKLAWEDIKILLEHHSEDFKSFAKQYFMEILKTLAYPTTTFYEIPFEGANPSVIIFSGHHRRVVITLEGEKLQSSYVLKGRIGDYIKDRKHRSLSFVEAGIDEELRKLAGQLRNLYKRLGGHS